MIRAGVLICFAGALLAGCGGGASNNNAQQPAIRMANKYHDDLAKLPPNLQRLAMMRAIRDSRYTCQRVDNSGYQEEYENLRMWVATCGGEGAGNFAVFLAPNGDVQVRKCEDAGRLSLPRCEGLPPAVPDDSGPQFKEGASDNAYRSRPATPSAN